MLVASCFVVREFVPLSPKNHPTTIIAMSAEDV